MFSSEALVIVFLLSVLRSAAFGVDGPSAIPAAEFVPQKIIDLYAALAVEIRLFLSPDFFINFGGDDLREDIVGFSVKTINAGIFLIFEDIVESAPPKRFSAVSYASLMKFCEDIFDIYAEGILPENKPDDFRLILIDGDFFAVFFITVEKMSAGVIAFAPGFVHAAANLLGKFSRIVFGITFEHAFENDSLGRIGDMFGGGEHFDAVFFEGAFVNRGFIFVAGKAIKLIDCHIFLWTVFYLFYR